MYNLQTVREQPRDPGDLLHYDLKASSSDQLTEHFHNRSVIGQGYTDRGKAPNGFPVTSAISFPSSPLEGDFVLRLDYQPNRLFRYDGNRWVKVEDNVRTGLDGDGTTQRDGFINNTGTYVDNKGQAKPSRTGLSKALEPDED